MNKKDIDIIANSNLPVKLHLIRPFWCPGAMNTTLQMISGISEGSTPQPHYFPEFSGAIGKFSEYLYFTMSTLLRYVFQCITQRNMRHSGALMIRTAAEAHAGPGAIRVNQQKPYFAPRILSIYLSEASLTGRKRHAAAHGRLSHNSYPGGGRVGSGRRLQAIGRSDPGFKGGNLGKTAF